MESPPSPPPPLPRKMGGSFIRSWEILRFLLPLGGGGGYLNIIEIKNLPPCLHFCIVYWKQWSWKNHCRLTLMEQICISTFCWYIFKNIFNPFLCSLKYIKKADILRGAQKEAKVMKWVKSNLIFSYLLCYSYK